MDSRIVLQDYMNSGDSGLFDKFDGTNPIHVDKKVRGLIYLLAVSPLYQPN